MSNRVVREPATALAQRLANLEDRVRALTLRAWPGAVRTGAEDGPITPEVPTAASTLITVSTVPGRWVMFAQVTITIPPTTGVFDLRLTLTPIDPETGEAPPPTKNLAAAIAALIAAGDVSSLEPRDFSTAVADLPTSVTDFDAPTRGIYMSDVSTVTLRQAVTLFGSYVGEGNVDVTLVAQNASTFADSYTATDVRLLLLPV